MEDRLTGQILADAFRLTRRLATGTVGMVYEADDLRRSKKVAVKLLHPSVSRDAEALARYQREARAASALGHPHVVEFVDFSPPDAKGAFIVTELLDGEDLGAHLARVRRLSMKAAVSITRDVLAALDAVHAIDVIHRDLQPRNVFLCRRDGRRDFVKLVDFGVACLRTATDGGTPARSHGAARYLAPEQVHGEAAEVDGRVDVWAAGVMLYEMLAGSPAFAGPDRATLLARVTQHEPAPLHTVRSEVTSELEAVIARALAKSPADRYPTARAMREALAAAARASGDWEEEAHPATLAVTPALPPLPVAPSALVDPFADIRTVPQARAPAPPPVPPAATTDPFSDVRTVPQDLAPGAAAEAQAAPRAPVAPEATMELSMEDLESAEPAPATPPPLPGRDQDDSLKFPTPVESVSEDERSRPVWRRPTVWIVAGVAAVVVVALIVIGSLGGRSRPAVTASAPQAAAQPAPAAPAARAAPASLPAAVAPATLPAPATAPAPDAVAAEPASAPVAVAVAETPMPASAPVPTPPDAPPPPPPASRPAAQPPRVKSARARPRAAAPKEDRGARLPRDTVRRVMAPLGKQVKACFHNFNVKRGRVTLSLTVAPSGQVQRASTVGRYAAQPAGGCAASAARRVSFPSFQGAPVTISYSYNLR